MLREIAGAVGEQDRQDLFRGYINHVQPSDYASILTNRSPGWFVATSGASAASTTPLKRMPLQSDAAQALCSAPDVSLRVFFDNDQVKPDRP